MSDLCAYVIRVRHMSVRQVFTSSVRVSSLHTECVHTTYIPIVRMCKTYMLKAYGVKIFFFIQKIENFMSGPGGGGLLFVSLYIGVDSSIL
jgi:hypothetical protein